MLLHVVRLIFASAVELFYSRNLTASYKTNNTEHPGVPEQSIIIIIIMRKICKLKFSKIK